MGCAAGKVVDPEDFSVMGTRVRSSSVECVFFLFWWGYGMAICVALRCTKNGAPYCRYVRMQQLAGRRGNGDGLLDRAPGGVANGREGWCRVQRNGAQQRSTKSLVFNQICQ